MSSKVGKVHQIVHFTHKLTTNSFLAQQWNTQDCGISKAVKDPSMLPSKIDQMKVSQETRCGSGTTIKFGCAFLPSYPAIRGSIFKFSDEARFAYLQQMG